jgi:hypothetical protein
LATFIWLRWRLRVNQLKRGGTLNAIVWAVVAAGAVVVGAGLFVVSLAMGATLLGPASPTVVLYVWDGLVIAQLAFWSMGLLAELQRAEVLSLEKFLHLPVSATGAFLVNYLSSLVCLNLVVFAPALVGLSLGLAVAKGPRMLLLLPVVAAFLLMVTALSYQLQGWLASLMANPRRRRTLVVLAAAAMVLVYQLPYLLHRLIPEESWDRMEEFLPLIHMILPPCWLPLGARGLAEDHLGPALLATLGLALIGTASLWRGYGTTLRLYRGQFTAGQGRSSAPPPAAKASRRRAGLLEARFPGLSEQTAAVALSGFRSLLRAPEAKMMLLSPVLVSVIFGGMVLNLAPKLADPLRPLMVLGALGMIGFTLVGLQGNLFGFDRGGFRVFVLCPAPRRDILLGKNLALAPVVLGLGLLAATVFQAILPMRVDHFLAVLVAYASLYLLSCLLGNLLSILAPSHVAAGSFRTARTSGISLLLHLAFTSLFPVVLAVTLLPLGVEVLIRWQGWLAGVPVALVLAVLEVGAVGYVYRLVLAWQGGLLQLREQRILEVVTSKAE